MMQPDVAVCLEIAHAYKSKQGTAQLPTLLSMLINLSRDVYKSPNSSKENTS